MLLFFIQNNSCQISDNFVSGVDVHGIPRIVRPPETMSGKWMLQKHIGISVKTVCNTQFPLYDLNIKLNGVAVSVSSYTLF